MPEFLTLLPPDEARDKLLAHLPPPNIDSETVTVDSALGRVLASDVFAPHALPEFPRSTVDGYAVIAKDTFGASESMPAYLRLAGSVSMGEAPQLELRPMQCAVIHTGGMLPVGADAVVMLEVAQLSKKGDGSEEVEIFKSAASGENIIHIGEDVSRNQKVISKGAVIRPAEIGGLMALGISKIDVAKKPRIGVISTGDEVIDPTQTPKTGQVRDINSYTLGALIKKYGGEITHYGIVRDDFLQLKLIAAKALSECDMIVITAGSSASVRDMTAAVIEELGEPGVLVHGINTRPGKPTILGVCNRKAVIGLPGNPVSALVNGYLFVAPLVERLLGATPKPRATIQVKLAVNLPSQAGREDWQPVRLVASTAMENNIVAEPIFGKSNLIFNLVAADGLLKIPAAATGLSAGEIVEVILL